jgi:hypothetical protein
MQSAIEHTPLQLHVAMLAYGIFPLGQTALHAVSSNACSLASSRHLYHFTTVPICILLLLRVWCVGDVSRTGRQLLVRLLDRLGRLGAEARVGAAEGLTACGK